LMPSMLEVISKDQFAFRLTVIPIVTVTDARAFHEGAPPLGNSPQDWMQGGQRYPRLMTELAAAVLEEVAKHPLEEFLADPAAALAPAKLRLEDTLPGSDLDGIAVTAVTLPPEVRKMFTEVERARREGLAGLERAKAEQASLRALANAARTLAGNPQLAQLRMLQTMESAKGAKTFILGKPPEELGVESGI
ncbi:MAG TPA: SPFH domain-containing protein, partial [Sphingomonadaceae bacterium]|nr:SPFH domain-containing protein [Sphingomonadaceae bacterium]